MYLNIKAFSKESFENFYNQVVPDNHIKKSTNIIYDQFFYHGVQITFYENLTILFKGDVFDDLKNKIDILIDSELYIGSDEVGVGESIGPLIACVLQFNNIDSKKNVIFNGIKDSKKMDWNEIKSKIKVIEENSKHHCVVLDPKKFNEIYKKKPNVKYINAIIQNELHRKMGSDGYHVIDQFVHESKYNEYLEKSESPKFNGKLLLITKAEEKYVEVAAAAILAKYKYNTWVIDNLKNDNYNLKIDKKLNSWELFLKIKNGDIIVKDKSLYMKEWKKQD